MKIKEYIIQNGEQYNGESCDEMLHRKLFDVNMRLYDENRYYRALIHEVIEHLLSCLETNFEDYAKVKGISGANVGIPFNIIAVRNGTKITPMLNPKLLKCSRKTRKVVSNCGSVNLKVGIEVERPEWISYSYHDISGRYLVVERAEISDGASTVLHEIEHNLGILIIDKQKKKGKSHENHRRPEGHQTSR